VIDTQQRIPTSRAKKKPYAASPLSLRVSGVMLQNLGMSRFSMPKTLRLQEGLKGLMRNGINAV